jgi:thioredoxin 1
VTVTDTTFTAEVERSPLPVLVDMWAAWCGPCRMIAPIMDELAGEHAGSVRFAKLNVDENPQTAARFNVLSIPMVTLFADGEAQETVVGARPQSYYEGAWDRWLAGQR